MKAELIPAAATGRILRHALRQAYPRARISIRTLSSALGDALDVAWADGPAESEVGAIADLYAGAPGAMTALQAV